MMRLAEANLQPDSVKLLHKDIADADKLQESFTAWRIEGTLREFPKFPPVNLWFKYPIHELGDDSGLQDLKSDEGGQNAGKRSCQSSRKPKKTPEEIKEEHKALRMAELDFAYESLVDVGIQPTVKKLAEEMKISEDSVKRYVKEHPDFSRNNGIISRAGK